MCPTSQFGKRSGSSVDPRSLMRRLISILVLSGALGVLHAPTAAKAVDSPVVVLDDCGERILLVPGVESLVRQRVPAQFELVRDPFGRPLLAVAGAKCERLGLAGSNRPPTKFGYFGAIIKSPDGGGCMSQLPVLGGVAADLVPFCNLYGFFNVNGNAEVVNAFIRQAPDIPFHYVSDLVYETGGFDLTKLGAPFSFKANAPTPSPYELDGITREGVLLPGPLTFTFWRTTAAGTVGARVEWDDAALGLMDATVRAARGSEMAELFGTQTPTPLFGFANRYSHAEIRPFGALGQGTPLAGGAVGAASATGKRRAALRRCNKKKGAARKKCKKRKERARARRK